MRPVGLAGDQRVASADEAQCFLEPVPLRYGRDLFREGLLAADSLQVSDLGIQSSLLITGLCSRVAHPNARYCRFRLSHDPTCNMVAKISIRNQNPYNDVGWKSPIAWEDPIGRY